MSAVSKGFVEEIVLPAIQNGLNSTENLNHVKPGNMDLASAISLLRSCKSSIETTIQDNSLEERSTRSFGL